MAGLTDLAIRNAHVRDRWGENDRLMASRLA